jgi:PA14 domain
VTDANGAIAQEDFCHGGSSLTAFFASASIDRRAGYCFRSMVMVQQSSCCWPALSTHRVEPSSKESCIMFGRYGYKNALVSVVAGTLLFQASLSPAQQRQVSLTAGWQQMSPSDFASSVRTLYSAGTFNSLKASDRRAAQAYGFQLFQQVDFSSTTLSYHTLEMLHWLSQNFLVPSMVDSTRAALLARQDNWAGQPFAEVLAKVMMLKRSDTPPAVVLQQAQLWVTAGGTLAQIPQNDLVYDVVRQMFGSPSVITGSFSVSWTSRVTAPQSGDYTFSISPINVNAGFKPHPIKVRVTFSVAGQLLLQSIPGDLGTASFPGYQDATPPANWTSQSQAVALTAGQPVSIQVTMTANTMKDFSPGTLHSMLYWQGPGVSYSLVPASSFTLPDGSGPGLQANYSWTSQGKPQTLTRTDPMIDFAWTNPAVLIAQNPTVPNQIADQMWQGLTSPAYLAALAGPPAQLHPFFSAADDVSIGLTTARRQAFLDLLLQNPTLLSPVDVPTAVRFYQAFRMGGPDKALEVFGTWAGRYANYASDFSDSRSFDGDSRLALADMAAFVTQQLPSQAAVLQNQYLQLPDGRCVLPVAYTLSYSYLSQKKQAAWIAFLDAKLADPTLTGDLRVNWLLARAHVQELLRNPSKHYPLRWPFPASWSIDGIGYLTQALNAAQSAPVKLRVAREIIGRYASAGQFQDATALLQQIEGSLPDPQKAIVAAWLQELASFVTYKQQQPARAKQAYLKALQARRLQAASRGDSTTVTHYDTLINAVQNRP